MTPKTHYGCVVLLLLMGLVLFPGGAPAQRKKPIRKRPLPRQRAAPVRKQAGSAVLGRIAGFPNWVTAVAISPDGKTLVAGSDGEVQKIDLSSRRVTATRKTRPGYVRALEFSPDGRLLAVGGYQSLELWDSRTFKTVKTLEGHTGQVTGAAFSPDGKLLVSCSHDETVRLWNVAGGKEIRKIGDFEYPVNGVAFSPDGKWIATASGDEYRITRHGLVKLWNAKTGAEKTWRTTDEKGKPSILRLVEHLKAANSVAFSPDGTTLISTSFDEKVNVYHLSTGKALGYFDGHGRPTNAALFMPDGKTVVSAAGGRFKGRDLVMVWNSADGEQFATLEGHRAPVTCLALSPDGKTLASGSHDKTVIIWSLASVLPKIEKARRESPVEAPRPKRKVNLRSRASRRGVAADSHPVADAPRSEQRQTSVADAGGSKRPTTLRIGIIGLDTSHVIAFTDLLNDPRAKTDLAGCRVVAAYPKGSPDILSSTSRAPKYTAGLKERGIRIVPSIPKLLEYVDAVLLETNDGRPHLQQVLPVLKAGKPVFIDKPLAGTLADVLAIFEAAKNYKTPVFSSSSLRYLPGAQRIRAGEIGTVKSAEAFSPAHLEKTHPDLFWYGVHGVEALFTMMGPGCQNVQRTVHTPLMDEVVGTWKGGRVGTFRGYRKGSGKGGYGGFAKGTRGELSAGKYAGYRPLLVEIVRFFRTRKPPVSERETIEIYAFMEAADESKRRGGEKVSLESVLRKARRAAKKRLAELDR